MKRTLLQLSFLTFGIAVNAQVEHGSFEDWVEVQLFELPVMSAEVTSSNHEFYITAEEANVTPIQKEGSTALKLQNIEVNGEVIPAFYIIGQTPSQEGEGLVFGEGISVSDPNITGISVDMAYDFPGESSGFVLLQFKEEGIPVGEGAMGPGTFFFPLSGQKEWGTETFELEEPLGVSFDQIVIGFASADLVSDDENFAEGAWIEVDNLAFVGSTETIENGDFETWEELPPVVSPIGVNVKLDLIEPVFERVNDASDGQYALALKTIVKPEYTQAARATIGTGDELALIDLTDDHDLLSFDYKYEAIDDLAMVVFTFYLSASDEYAEVYSTSLNLEPSDSFISTEINYKELLSANQIEADKVSIEFISSKENLQVNEESILIVDNLASSGLLTSMFRNPFPSPNRLVASPNPTLGRSTFRFATPSTGFYRVFNSQGFLIETVHYNDRLSITHNLYEYPSGYYLFRFYDLYGIRSARVVKN